MNTGAKMLKGQISEIPVRKTGHIGSREARRRLPHHINNPMPRPQKISANSRYVGYVERPVMYTRSSETPAMISR